MEEIIGRGIIIHGGEDDLQSQPLGERRVQELDVE